MLGHCQSGLLGVFCKGFNGWHKQEFGLTVTCMCCLLHITFAECETCLCLCLPSNKQFLGWGEGSGCSLEQEGWEGDVCTAAKLLCPAQAGLAAPQSPCPAGRALAQPCAPGLGTGSVYVMKGSRRWLFLSSAFAHKCAGPGPGWKLCPHEQREGDGRSER